MNGLRLIPDTYTMSFDRTLPGSADWVWWHLTEPDGLRMWLADAQIEARPGGTIHLRFPEGDPLMRAYGDDSMRGSINCFEPCRRLAYSWLDATRQTASSGRIQVTFQLTGGEGRTLLSLTHVGCTARALPRLTDGWQAHLASLANALSEEADSRFIASRRPVSPFSTYVESFGMRA